MTNFAWRTQRMPLARTQTPCARSPASATNAPGNRGWRLIALALATVLTACATSPIQQSRDLWSEGRFEEAVALLQEASKKDPDDRRLLAAYHRQRDLAFSQLSIAAESALAARRLDEAKSLYERALRLDPNSERAKDGLARIALAHQLDSDFTEAQRLAEQGHTAEAEAKLRQIVATEPSNRRARQLLRQLRERQQMMLE
ncbi:MAG TPA: tetratricopeptide repeat protein, partial [Burkholderiaceae bacterium]|nr:tetratricopeptide repeat protein [Burkholderiaceae bacterium]